MKNILFVLLCYAYGFSLIASSNETSIRFTENKGQWQSDILFRAEIPSGFLYIKKNGWHFTMYDASEIERQHHNLAENTNTRTADSPLIKGHGIEVVLENANINTRIEAHNASTDIRHYFFGNTSSKWVSAVHSFSEVYFQEIYTGVDFRIFAYKNSLKYEFIVKPNADVSQIKLLYTGADKILLEKGNLQITHSVGLLQELKPYSFQEVGMASQEISSDFQVQDSRVQFAFAKGYDKSKILTIDPQLVFSTFSGSLADNWGHTATHDSYGNLYAGGSVLGDRAFPVTAGAFQINHGSPLSNQLWDVAILKFNSTGSQLMYASYLGGSQTDIPTSMICTPTGDLLVLGMTSSIDFPTTPQAYDRSFNGGTTVFGQILQPIGGMSFVNGSDIFVSKISADGSKLIASTFMGGSGNDGINMMRELLAQNETHLGIRNYGDEYRGEIFLDADNRVYVASVTNSYDFPLVNASQNAKNGSFDAVAFRLTSDLSALEWSTFFGGTAYDAAHGIRVANNNDVYICGSTSSPALPNADYGLNRQNMGTSRQSSATDGFVAKFSKDKLVSSTFIGTSEADIADLIDLDANQNVYIFGQTSGTYPVSTGVYSNANSGQYIQALNKDLNASVFSTVIGSGRNQPDITPTAFLVNECGNIYLAGWGGKINDNVQPIPTHRSTTTGLPITSDAYRSTTDGNNFYIMLLETGAKSLLYATFFGSTNTQAGDHVDGGTCRFDKRGLIYHAACSCNRNGSPANFTTTPGAWSQSNPSNNCNNAAFKFDIDNLNVLFDAVSGNQTSRSDKADTIVVCSPAKVTFQNRSTGGKTYEWDLAGIRKSNNQSQEEYTFDKAGFYTITLKGSNPLSCSGGVPAKKVIKVNAANFVIKGDTTICNGGKASFFVTGLGKLSVTWLPAGTLNNASIAEPIASPLQTTTYTAEIKNEFGCSEKKSVTVQISDAFARTSPDTSVCKGKSIMLRASGGTSYRWLSNVPDSTVANPIVSISKNTQFIVQILNEKTGCKAQKNINITLDESFKPSFKVSVENTCGKTPVVLLENLTKNADRILWNFGNGITLIDPSVKTYIYSGAGKYPITLTAYKADCSISQTQEVQIEPLIIVPNVITPNNDGKNDVLVLNASIKKIEIYNRWGVSVFQTESYTNDWGNNVATGTYYYLLTTESGSICKGWIEVLK